MSFWKRKTSEPSKQSSPHTHVHTTRQEEEGPGLGQVKYVIAVASGKGGVGKSTVATNLAVALQHLGKRVGLMDADIYGPSQPTLLGAKQERMDTEGGHLEPLHKHNVAFVSMGLLMGTEGPVVWRAPMATKLMHQFIANVNWGSLDYLLIDLPPGTGDVQLTLAQQANLAGAVIVTTPQDVALGIAQKGLKMFEQVHVPILGIVENMSGFTCEKCGHQSEPFKIGGGKHLAKLCKVPFLGALPLDKDLMASSDTGIPVAVRAPESAAARRFSDLARALEEQIAVLAEKSAQAPKVHLTDSGVQILWPEGLAQQLDPYTLRSQCGCALCVDENSGMRLLDPKTIPLDIRILGMELVGRYGIAPRFSDGHNSGIFTFEKLKALQGSKPPAFSV